MEIILSPYDPSWENSFEEIATRIRSALTDRALLIEHVGSTAVPHLAAKPVIDVVLLVPDSSKEHEYVKDLEAAGFDLHAREPDWWEHRLFKSRSPLANIHVFSIRCSEADRMIEFRDLLRRDTDARNTYETRKRELARQEWDRVQDYADAKADIVQKLLGVNEGNQ